MKIQSSPFPHISSLKFIGINKETFLIFSFYKSVIRGEDKYDWGTNVQVFKFVENARYFYFDSVLPGSGVTDVECFTSQTKTYLIIANYRNNFGGLALAASVYEYNNNLRKFLPIQTLPTSGVLDVEHFVLSNEDYIVIANEASGNVDAKIFDVSSTVYRLNKGKFYLLQTLDTYGAKFWKHAPIANCKQDVLLIYGDQRDNIDQVGIFSFSHHEESFSAVPFQIYNTGEMSLSFRADPSTVATFTSLNITSASNSLQIIIGANNASEGSSVYEITYDVILRDSPLEAFKRFVAQEIKEINSTLLQAISLLDNAEFILDDAVLKSEKQNITGKKTLTGGLQLINATLESLTMINGSILYKTDNGEERKDPSSSENVDVPSLEQDISGQDTWLTETSARTFWLVESNETISSSVKLDNAIVNSNIQVVGDLNTGLINGVNLTELYDNLISRNQKLIELHDTITFSNLQTFESMTVNNTINNLSFPSDFFLNGHNQTVDGSKTFHNDLHFQGNLLTNNIDSIDLTSAAVLKNRPATITGHKIFDTLLAANSTATLKINGASFDEVFRNNFRRSISQSISGNKVFKRVTSNRNVKITNLINGIDLQDLKQRLSGNNQSSQLIDEDKVESFYKLFLLVT